MKSYEEIKEEELNVTSKYTDRQFSIYFNFFKILRLFFTEGFLWFISILIFAGIWSVFYFLDFLSLDSLSAFIFVLSHFLYWVFKGKISDKELIDDVVPELDLILKSLSEIKEMRKNG